MMHEQDTRTERGAVAVTVAIISVLLAGMAAFTVDLGAQYNARRQVQSAADTSVLAGTQEAEAGIAAVSDVIADTVRDNVERTYTDAEWSSMWSTANCSDPDAYEISGVVDGAPTNCVSFDPAGIVRVRVPEIEVEAVFAGVLGVDGLSVDATAEARLEMPGGVLPFAMLSGGSGGGEMCLKTASGGGAYGPCDGPANGNFGALVSSIYGSVSHGTQDLNCGTVNDGDNIAVNASAGVDHMLLPHRGAGNVDDTCARPYGPNRLETITGNNSPAIMQGLVNGVSVSGDWFDGLLTKTTNTTVEIQNGGSNVNNIDIRPLWEYIPTGKPADVPGGVPAICTRESLDAELASNGPESANDQLVDCLEEYAADPLGLGFGLLFDLDSDGDRVWDIADSPRFGYVPRMQESSFPAGTSGWLTIDGFQVVYIQSLFFGCTGTGCSDIVYPGIDDADNSINVGGGASVLDQVSSLVLPAGSLPIELEFESALLDFTNPELVR
mgnify:FL=1